MGGMRGDDAIEPGAPPTCFCAPACAAGAAAAVAATGIFADDDDDADLRRLRFFFELGI